MRDLKQSRAVETRKKILREAAEVTNGAFFHHFKGKDDLAFAVIDQHMEERCRTLDRIEKGLPEAKENDPLELVVRRLDAAAEPEGWLFDRESEHGLE